MRHARTGTHPPGTFVEGAQKPLAAGTEPLELPRDVRAGHDLAPALREHADGLAEPAPGVPDAREHAVERPRDPAR